jgi:hypothetical protein
MRGIIGSFIFAAGLILAAPGIWLAELGEKIRGESEQQAQVRRFLDTIRQKHG